MANDMNLRFISEKIHQLRNAVMYVSSNNPLKPGNDIVTAVKVDEEGQLWLLMNRPVFVKECEQTFPARLRFHRKGVPFFIEISGKATIVNNNYFNYADSGKKARSQYPPKMLVKLSMVNIEYTEPHTKRPKTKMEIVMENWYTWFLRNVSIPHDSGSVLKKLRQTN